MGADMRITIPEKLYHLKYDILQTQQTISVRL